MIESKDAPKYAVVNEDKDLVWMDNCIWLLGCFLVGLNAVGLTIIVKVILNL